jgi:murein DD-endopeptidase MepM/ murein hydrolase activator NlpD
LVLDQGKRRGAYRLEAEHIDLGNEPPLSVDGESSGLVDRRRVSVQWFSGTILTGLCGAALMGGAVFAALDGETNFATVPERVEATLRSAVSGIGDRLANATRKSDRLPPPGEANAARQTIRVSTTTRGAGNREIVRVRPFTRVAGNLSLSASELSASIPPFNALKMLAQSDGAAVAAHDAGAEPDAEVSFFTRDLATVLPRAKIAAAVGLDEIVARVGEAANWNPGSARPAITGSIPPMAYAPERHNDPYAGFEPRIVPENITLLPKTTTQATGGNAWNERTIVLKKGDSVAATLRELGATGDEVKAIATAFGRGRDSSPKDGYKLRVLLAPADRGKRLQPVRVIVATDTSIDAMVAWSDKGKYVAVDVRSANTVASTTDDDEDDGKGVRLYHSIYETALRNQVPRPVIDDLIRIYSYDVDFQRKVQPGDSFEILFAGEDETSNDGGKTEVLFASLTTGGETRKFYRHQTTDDNVVDYYDESGKSAKKFLVRKPLADGIVRSGFGSRNHPILGYMKMHTGIDWAASMGTPIFASGNGVIDKVGWEGGYGKYIRIRHANGYETAYGHMSAFARGMEPGKKVRQGQVIGYVGSTGLSTGAHLHYEILINGRFVDPMRIKLPRGRVLDGTLLAGFEQERTKLDTMMTRGATSRYADGVPRR